MLSKDNHIIKRYTELINEDSDINNKINTEPDLDKKEDLTNKRYLIELAINNINERIIEILKNDIEIKNYEGIFREIGIVKIDNIWYNLNLENNDFPRNILDGILNKSFNIGNNIGNENGEIINWNDLKKLFKKIGFTVANNIQEKAYLKKTILENKDKLKEIYFFEKKGKWFYNIIKNKNFNKRYIGNIYIKNIDELIILFKKAGIYYKELEENKYYDYNKIKEEYIELIREYNRISKKVSRLENGEEIIKEDNSIDNDKIINSKKEEIIKLRKELKNINKKIKSINKELLFDNNSNKRLKNILEKVTKQELKINKTLNKIKNDIKRIIVHSKIKKEKQKQKDEQENEKKSLIEYKNCINDAINTLNEKIKKILKDEIEIQENNGLFNDIGIKKINNIWYFFKIKGINVRPNILGNRLNGITSIWFNKRNNIGNENGVITNGEHLKGLFEKIGLIIATKEQEINELRNIIFENKDKIKGISINNIKGELYYIIKNQKEFKGIKIGNLHKNNFFDFENLLIELGFLNIKEIKN